MVLVFCKNRHISNITSKYEFAIVKQTYYKYPHYKGEGKELRMINTINFKTKTILSERNNPVRGNIWNIGLDIGYSSVKGFSPNAVSCFPAFAKKASDTPSMAAPKPTDIQYRNDITGEIWDVGENAQNRATANDSEVSLFTKVRFFSEMFRVISEVGMAFGMLKNKYGSPEGKEVFLQTGLPPEHIDSLGDDLREALSGTHKFSIKIGNKNWISFDFELDMDHIYKVIGQPMGTLISVATGSNGRPVAEAARYFSKNILIIDAGFGTLDVYNLNKGNIASTPETIDDMGMKQVFKETIATIKEKFKKDISILEMQTVLETGKISVFERKERRSTSKNIADILEASNQKVCEEALAHICNSYNDLIDHDYLIITGGTCSAWSSIIREFFSGMETLTILSGAQNDNLSAVFSNVRGYYMYALNKK